MTSEEVRAERQRTWCEFVATNDIMNTVPYETEWRLEMAHGDGFLSGIEFAQRSFKETLLQPSDEEIPTGGPVITQAEMMAATRGEL